MRYQRKLDLNFAEVTRKSANQQRWHEKGLGRSISCSRFIQAYDDFTLATQRVTILYVLYLQKEP